MTKGHGEEGGAGATAAKDQDKESGARATKESGASLRC